MKETGEEEEVPSFKKRETKYIASSMHATGQVMSQGLIDGAPK